MFDLNLVRKAHSEVGKITKKRKKKTLFVDQVFIVKIVFLVVKKPLNHLKSSQE